MRVRPTVLIDRPLPAEIDVKARAIFRNLYARRICRQIWDLRGLLPLKLYDERTAMELTAVAAGTRVRVLAMNDPQPVPSGTHGTVAGTTDMGSWVRIAVRWDNGSSLALAVPPDRYEIIP
jgi:uncharacterized protein DUF4314